MCFQSRSPEPPCDPNHVRAAHLQLISSQLPNTSAPALAHAATSSAGALRPGPEQPHAQSVPIRGSGQGSRGLGHTRSPAEADGGVGGQPGLGVSQAGGAARLLRGLFVAGIARGAPLGHASPSADAALALGPAVGASRLGHGHAALQSSGLELRELGSRRGMGPPPATHPSPQPRTGARMGSRGKEKLPVWLGQLSGPLCCHVAPAGYESWNH